MEEKQWNVISKKIRRNVPVLTNPAAERASVVNVLLIIGIWVNSPDVYSLPRWREPMTVQLKNFLKRIRNIEKNYIIMQNK
ncbi:hypothetical protein ES705_10198 [subsurface metagenome]